VLSALRLSGHLVAAGAFLVSACSDPSPTDPGTTADASVTSDAPNQGGDVEPDVSTTPDAATRVCTPGVLSCADPRTAQVCNADGSGYDTTACEDGLTCWPDSGKCKVPNCEPGETECRGLDGVRTCGEYGIQWGETVDCPADTYCDGGECVGCTVGGFECLSDLTYRECTDGTTWSEETACGDGRACFQDQCCNFTGSCNEDGQAVAMCTTADGTVLRDEVTTCMAGTQCYEGKCVVCIPGTTQCMGESYQECLASGMDFGPATTCPGDQTCVGGKCTVDGCLPRVLLVVDRSGSMSGEWDEVTASVSALVNNNPGYYGLIAFPGSLDSCGAPDELDVPMGLNNSFALNLWMSNASVTGATPLLEVMDKMTWMAPTALEGNPGTIVVLSDGDDSCASGNVPNQLGPIAASLKAQYNITTYAIGYGYSDMNKSAELNSLMSNGGSGLSEHIVAGNEIELTNAFQGIIDDVKYCD